MTVDLKEIRILDRIAAEAAVRPMRKLKIEVVKFKPSSKRSGVPLALEGTVTLLMARRGSRLMAEIREALATGIDTEPLAKRLYLQYKHRTEVSLSQAVETAINQPVFAEVFHGDRLLHQAVFVPEDMEVAFLPFPYNGGAMAESGLTLVEHPLTHDTESLDIIALQHAPHLTAAEEAALKLVPPEQVALNIGSGPGSVACSVVLLTVLVVAEVAIVAVTYAVTGGISFQKMQSFSEDELERLGPETTARNLVALRRQLLETPPVGRVSDFQSRAGV